MSSFQKDIVNENVSISNTEADKSGGNYILSVFYYTLNVLTHVLIGLVMGANLIFAFRFGLPLNTLDLHIVLCCIGFQLLMAQSILALSPYNGWSMNLRFVDKRRVHSILQVVGSGMALAGCFIYIIAKNQHSNLNWDTYHGQWALVSMVFTVASFFNGITSEYAYDLRRFLPAWLSKLTHICFGIVAFAAAGISLCYGFDKISFRLWAGPGMTIAIIVLTGVMTAIVILNPLIVFITKSKNVIKR